MSKHHFILTGEGDHAGWWLKITSVDELFEYIETHSDRYGKAFMNITMDKDYGAPTVTHGKYPQYDALSQAIYFNASNNKKSIIESTLEISGKVSSAQVDALCENGYIYINSVGGWCDKLISTPRSFIYKEGFTFPHFTKSDIHISKFPGGQHYYAHIGEMEVRDGDTIKWNTREEAYKQALKFLIN